MFMIELRTWCYDSTGCRLVSVPYPCMTVRCALFAFSSEGTAVSGEAQLYILQHIIMVIDVRVSVLDTQGDRAKPNYTVGLPVE